MDADFGKELFRAKRVEIMQKIIVSVICFFAILIGIAIWFEGIIMLLILNFLFNISLDTPFWVGAIVVIIGIFYSIYIWSLDDLKILETIVYERGVFLRVGLRKKAVYFDDIVALKGGFDDLYTKATQIIGHVLLDELDNTAYDWLEEKMSYIPFNYDLKDRVMFLYEHISEGVLEYLKDFDKDDLHVLDVVLNKGKPMVVASRAAPTLLSIYFARMIEVHNITPSGLPNLKLSFGKHLDIENNSLIYYPSLTRSGKRSLHGMKTVPLDDIKRLNKHISLVEIITMDASIQINHADLLNGRLLSYILDMIVKVNNDKF